MSGIERSSRAELGLVSSIAATGENLLR